MACRFQSILQFALDAPSPSPRQNAEVSHNQRRHPPGPETNKNGLETSEAKSRGACVHHMTTEWPSRGRTVEGS